MSIKVAIEDVETGEIIEQDTFYSIRDVDTWFGIQKRKRGYQAMFTDSLDTIWQDRKGKRVRFTAATIEEYPIRQFCLEWAKALRQVPIEELRHWVMSMRETNTSEEGLLNLAITEKIMEVREAIDAYEQFLRKGE